MSEPLLLGAALAALTAGLYAIVGVLMLRRVPGGDGRLAMQLFATWWLTLGGVTLIGGLHSALVAWGATSLPLHETLAHLNVLLLTVALGSLLFYLLYLHLGERRILWPLLVFYGAVYVYFVYLTSWLDPVGVEVKGLSAEIDYARELEGPHLWATLVLLLAPATLAALLYGSLFFRLRERAHRYRIALVSGSFALWFGGLPLVGLASGVAHAPWWPLASRAFGLVVPLLILAAYLPPKVVRAWLARTDGAKTP